MGQANIPPEQQQDPFGRRVPGEGRDGCRTPMQWTSDSGAGFSNAAPEDIWLPFGDDASTRNVQAQLREPTSLLSLYRALLRLRRNEPALHRGDQRTLDSPHGIFRFERTLANDRFHVASNFTATPIEVEPVSGTIELSTDPKRMVGSPAPRELRPNEGVVIRLT